MKRDFRVYLDDVLESITRIKEYTESIDEEEFLKNVPVQDAVIRRFEIIGEAVKNIPDEIKQKYPAVEWKKVAGARDIFSHEYFGVKLDRVWDTIINDLPLFKEQTEKILKDYSK